MSCNRVFAVHTLLACLALAFAGASQAQEEDDDSAPSVRELVDDNGVDLTTGKMVAFYVGPSIGPAGQRMQFVREFRGIRGAKFRDRHKNYIKNVQNTNNVLVALDERSITFSESPTGTFTPVEQNGETLTVSDTTYVFTSRDGTVATYVAPSANLVVYPANARALLGSVTYPNGERITAEYETVTYCAFGAPGCTMQKTAQRLKALVNNYGYKMALSYAVIPAAPIGEDDVLRPIEVTFINLTTNTVVGTLNIVIESGSGETAHTLTDTLGRSVVYTYGSGPAGAGKGITAIRFPGSSTDDVTVSYNTDGRVSSVNSNGRVTNYSYVEGGGNLTTAVTRVGVTGTRVVVSELNTGRVLSDTDQLSRTVSYSYDAQGRLFRVTAPEGNSVEYTYDTRGNVTQTRARAKPGSGLADIVTTAGFDAICANPKTCNKPNWTRDAKGQQTDFTYDANHGGVLTVTLPAPTAGAVRPQTRFTYTALEAWYLNASGELAPSGQPIHLLTEVSTCRTQTSCAGTDDEMKTVIGYGSSGMPDNPWPVIVTSRNGTGSLVSTVTTSYDSAGNVRSVDGALAGAGDTRRTHYDALRRVVGVIGPDPDGASGRKPVAIRRTYDSAGRLTLVEKGTVNGQTDADWSSFTPAESVSLAYDAAGRRIRSSLIAGATTYAVEQVSYDAQGRTECVAIRMNPATFSSLPASACTLATTGSYGPDRVTRYTYDAADQVTSVTQGYGTTNSIAVTTTTYTANGRAQTVADGKGNLTTYEYDGFDRLFRTRFPSPTSPGASSISDYEERGYDASSNVTSLRARNGAMTAFTWDYLNRLLVKDLPTGGGHDTYFAFDNHGRLLSARHDSSTGPGIVNDYDGLGRLASRTVYGRTLSYGYDAAHRRTRITYPDNFYAEYAYNAADELTSVSDSAGVALASFTYDALGRRSTIARANGTHTSFTYDPVSRLDSLVQNLAGTGQDSTLDFAYSPSAQIATLTQSNDAAYTWIPGTSGSVSKSHNGLNQLTQTGATLVTHDPLGNVQTGDSNFEYGFDLESQMRSAEAGTTSVSLEYDPLGMLHEITHNGSSKQLLYDGPDLVAEYAGQTLLRRYVHGPGLDEPLVWYEGVDTNDRRYLHADERGSIVAISDSAGTALATFKYSPDGESSNAASSRFGYTGQVYLDDLGVYYYKSRMYSPRLGRFLQTDRIGYAGGMNLYAYVGGDPINRVDFFGFCDDAPKERDDDVDCIGTITVTAGCLDWVCGTDITGRALNDPAEPRRGRAGDRRGHPVDQSGLANEDAATIIIGTSSAGVGAGMVWGTSVIAAHGWVGLTAVEAFAGLAVLGGVGGLVVGTVIVVGVAIYMAHDGD